MDALPGLRAHDVLNQGDLAFLVAEQRVLDHQQVAVADGADRADRAFDRLGRIHADGRLDLAVAARRVLQVDRRPGRRRRPDAKPDRGRAAADLLQPPVQQLPVAGDLSLAAVAGRSCHARSMRASSVLVSSASRPATRVAVSHGGRPVSAVGMRAEVGVGRSGALVVVVPEGGRRARSSGVQLPDDLEVGALDVVERVVDTDDLLAHPVDLVQWSLCRFRRLRPRPRAVLLLPGPGGDHRGRAGQIAQVVVQAQLVDDLHQVQGSQHRDSSPRSWGSTRGARNAAIRLSQTRLRSCSRTSGPGASCTARRSAVTSPLWTAWTRARGGARTAGPPAPVPGRAGRQAR